MSEFHCDQGRKAAPKRMNPPAANVRIWGGKHSAYFDADSNQVRVWDSVAGYWTTCHSLTANQIKRVKRLATWR